MCQPSYCSNVENIIKQFGNRIYTTLDCCVVAKPCTHFQSVKAE